MSDPDDFDKISSGLFGSHPSDLQPLVDLLRSNRPISAGIRDMLAQMIEPSTPGYLYLRFDLRDTEGKVRNQDRDLKTLEIANFHAALKAGGKSSNQAAIETGAKFGLDQRKVYERLRDAKALVEWVKGQS